MDSGDFQRSVGDRSVGKVWQLRGGWLFGWKKGSVGKDGKGRLQFCACRIVDWGSGRIGVGTAWSGMGVGAGSQMGACRGPGC